jgi:hypothetical protein
VDAGRIGERDAQRHAIGTNDHHDREAEKLMLSIKEWLDARGLEVPEGDYICRGIRASGLPCTHRGGAWALYVVSESPLVGRCGACIEDARRLHCAAVEAAALPDLTWAGEAANAVRARRDAMINAWLWAVLPGSPLTVECQTEVADMIAALHRLTVEFSAPAAVQWPVPPTLTYA